jgi:hypothetical protein
MTARMILTGDLNVNIEDPSRPLGRVRDVLGHTLVFSNHTGALPAEVAIVIASCLRGLHSAGL